MAPRAPYSPIPQESPGGRPIGNLTLSAPAAAFGGSVGEALSTLGKTMEKSADELFARATAMQQLDNQAAAQAAEAEFINRTAEMHANFQSTRGKATVEAFPQYRDDIQRIRGEIEDTLPNDQTKKLFSNSTRLSTARAVFSGASYSARQNKEYLKETSDASLAAKGAQAAEYEEGPEFDKFVKDLAAKEYQEQSIYMGWDKTIYDNKVSEYVSEQWAKRLITLSKTDPYRAEAEYKQFKNDIRYQNRAQVENSIMSNKRQIGSRNISEAVNGGWAPYMKPAEISRANGVEEPLIRIVKEAQRTSDIQFTIGDKGGRRSAEEQAALVRKGVSWTYNSNHMTGRAVDLIPIGPDGKPNYHDREGMAKIHEAMTAASERLGIPLQKPSGNFFRRDPAHHELPRDYDVSMAPPPKEEPLSSRIERADRHADKTAGEDSTYAWYVAQRVQADFNRTVRLRQEAKQADMNTIATAIYGEAEDRKNLPTSIEQLRAISPEMSAAIDRIETQYPQDMKKIYTALEKNAKGDVPNTETRQNTYNRYKGMSIVPSDQADFMAVDLDSLDLTRQQRADLQNRRSKLLAKAEGDPSVTRVLNMGVVKNMLKDARIATTSNSYKEFAGALQGAIQGYMDSEKQQPPPDEAVKIVSRLLTEQNKEWYEFSRLGYDAKVPEDFKALVLKQPIWRELGRGPSDAEMRHAYMRDIFKKLYAKPPKAENPKADSQ